MTITATERVQDHPPARHGTGPAVDEAWRFHWVMDHSQTRHGARIVMVTLALLLDINKAEGICIAASNAELITSTRLSGNALRVSIAKAERLGELEVYRHTGPGGITVYRLALIPGYPMPPSLHVPVAHRPTGLLAADIVTRKTVPPEVVYAVHQQHGWRCVKCGRSREDGVELTMGHIIPVAFGGSDDMVNLRTECRPCNVSEGPAIRKAVREGLPWLVSSDATGRDA